MRKRTKKASTTSVRILSSKVPYRGPVFQVTSDQVKEPGGIQTWRDIVRHSGSVVILALDEGGKTNKGRSGVARQEVRILLERQYRYAANQFLWELPAGRIDEGEDELPAAQRELLEETGFKAKHWRRVLYFYPSPGFLDETMAIYLATGLDRGVAQPEDDEAIRTRFFSLSQAVRMVMNGGIADAKTIIGTLWLDRKRVEKSP
ncbi:MAG TPA: NUDIX hydrolase [Terriglobales bacterium]|nr:NUDIX hydrolase [Terriglobales bacterium]